MGFLDTVILPNSQPNATLSASNSKGSFLNSVILPANQARADKIASLQQSLEQTKAEDTSTTSLSGVAMNTLKGVGKTLLNIPINFAKSLWQTYSETPSKLSQDIQQGVTDTSKESLNTNFGMGALKAGFRTAGDAAIAVFAPISSAIGAALTATGGQQLLDTTGKVVADKNGITDLPAFQKFATDHPNAGEDFNRLLTLFLSGGEKGTLDPLRITTEAQNLSARLISDAKSSESKTLSVTSETPGETKIPIQTPATKQTAYAKSQGYEPYVPPDQLPTIQMGVKAKSELPTIQTESPAFNKLGSLRYEPISQETAPQVKEGSLESVQKPETPSVEAPVPPREAGVAKSASDINQNLVKQGFEALPVEEQAKYTPQSYKAVADKVATMMDTNIENTKSMAKGDTPIPPDVNPQILFNAIEAHATKNGDVQLLRDLANSPHATKLSEAGQTLGGHGYNDNPNSAVKIIKDVKTARETSVAKKSGGEKGAVRVKQSVVEDIKSEMRKNASKRPTWEEFINQIKCNS